MKKLVIVVLAAISCSTAAFAQSAEVGARPASLATASLQHGDWQRAERLLTAEDRGAAADPARLINLGKVYWETGRHEQARDAWRRAAAMEPVDVDTVGGRTLSTTVLARQALALYGGRAAVEVSSR